MLRFSEHLSASDGEAMFRHACAMGWRALSPSAPHEPLQVRRLPELAEGEERRL